ncbi:MAG: NADPH-dependent assimilatory sulfite reductase hemoprotein subunit [Ktedonobacteraceae bacterium]|nr:NADPH-dependent assimilatory sulfite reductase hemoprotein subunit [Ktedonobacteraceae bacterium]MBV9021452.1 NADPH-dependent assimilatory sulfite reductase hemoprotein subunit [Ktedonobacteraceae bacterium]
MPDQQETTDTLISLGPGVGSKVERIKSESNYLRGQVAEELAQDSTHFSEAQVQLIKFHGIYQQEDRDARQTRKATGSEKAYQFMIRSRIPGGTLTAEQYCVHDDLADRYANGTLRVTTRQSFQLHGVLKGNLHPTIHAINESLLSTLSACGDVNRNVMACPAPAANRAQSQVQEIAHRIAMHLAPRSRAYHEIWVDGTQVETAKQTEEDETEPMYGPTYLPRKFKIGVAFPGDNCIDVYTQDIGLVACLEGESLHGFTVLIGGGMGMTHGKSETHPHLALPLCYATSDEILSVVETIVTIQRDYGDRQNRKHARMKYVVEERGIPWFRAELERRLGRSVQDPRAITWHEVEDHLGWHAQGDRLWFLGLYIENGRVKDDATVRLRTGLRHAVEEFRPGIRLTAQQNILFTDLTEQQREPLTELLATYGIATDPAQLGTRRFAMACPALPTCGLALTDAERVLPTVVQQIEADLAALGLADEPLSIRMTGCPNGCARPYMGDIGFVGRTKDVYNMYIGGDLLNTRLNTLYAASVRLKDLAATVRPLLVLWRGERRAEEGFGDFCYRVGLEYLHTQTEAAV